MSDQKPIVSGKLSIDLSPVKKSEKPHTLYVRIKKSNFDFLTQQASAAGLSLAVYMDRLVEALRDAK